MRRTLAAAAFAWITVGCGGTSHTVADSGVVADVASGQDVAAGGTLAGAHCTSNSACGSAGLMCDTTQPGGWCSGICTATTAAEAQAMCGGTGAACVIEGLGTAMAQGFCTNACSPSASTLATGACAAGYVCTGLWFDSMTLMPSATGCIPFCAEDSQCGAAGAHCNVRTGRCGASTYNAAGLPDGSPCDPTVTVMLPGSSVPVNNQCRGQCAQDTQNAQQGVCQSLINLKVTTTCPDNPTHVQPLAPSSNEVPTDDFAVCANALCASNADCVTPLECVPATGSTAVTICDYPPAADGGTGADASVTDAH